MNAARHRCYELDLLRFLAAFAVVLFHYTFRGSAADGMTTLAYWHLAPWTKYGYLGVHLFFLISGFVILMTAYGKTPKEFVVSRVVRLYPAYWFCCTLTFATACALGEAQYAVSVKDYLVNMTMLNGFVGLPHVDTVYWSLAVELRFYCFVFLLLCLRQIGHVQYYFGGWLAAAFLALWIPTGFARSFIMPEFAAYFVAGAMFYLIHREGASWYRTVVIVASYVLAVAESARRAEQLSTQFDTPISPVVVAAVLAVFYGLFYLIATHETARLASPKFLWLGALTYPLYLLHQHIGFMVFNALQDSVNAHVLVWGTTAAMLALSYFVNVAIEKPCARRLRDLLTWLLAMRSPPTQWKITTAGEPANVTPE
jgi:peptidoglycan/LPS O-acetylase OafA/YrhL